VGADCRANEGNHHRSHYAGPVRPCVTC
jgi:hypothetical protein